MQANLFTKFGKHVTKATLVRDRKTSVDAAHCWCSRGKLQYSFEAFSP